MFNRDGRGMTTTSQDMEHPLKCAVLVSSVRQQRLGHLLAGWITTRATDAGHLVDLIDLAAVELPSDVLLEPGGGPSTVLSARLGAADAFIAVTPEYNASFPASLKRALDWHYTEWQFKAALIVSYGVRGGWRAEAQLRTVLAELSVVATRRSLGIRAPWESTSPDGFEPQPDLNQALGAGLEELAWWAATLRSARLERPFAG